MRARGDAAAVDQRAADARVHIEHDAAGEALGGAARKLGDGGVARVVAHVEADPGRNRLARTERGELDVLPAEVRCLDEPAAAHDPGGRDRDRPDPLTVRPPHAGELPSNHAYHRLALPVVLLARGRHHPAAQLAELDPPCLVRDRDRGHERPLAMRPERPRRPAAARGDGRLALRQPADGDEARDKIGREAARNPDRGREPGARDPRRAVHRPQHLAGPARRLWDNAHGFSLVPEYIRRRMLQMTTLTARPRPRRPSPTTLRLLVLAAACFVFVTTETQPVALLEPMARGLHVSESTVGLLMTAYAGIAAISAIPLTVLASRMRRRRLVIVTMATLVASQLALGVAPVYGAALGARLIGALAHGVYWAVLAQIIAGLVPRERVGRATAAVLAGNSVALVAGTPLVSALGALVGWRAAVGAMGAAALAVVVAMGFVIPDVPAASGLAEGRRAMLTRATRHPGVLIVCGVTVLLAFGQFVAFTYLAPLVRAHTGLTGTGVSAMLLAYGVAGVLGVVLVGRIADHQPRRALLTCCTGIVAGLALIAAVPHGTLVMVLATLAWGAGFTALPICLQSAVLRVAPEIPDTASALYVVAFQIGIGGGALAGAGLLGAHELSAIPDVTLAVFLAGSLLATAARATFAPDGAPPPRSLRAGGRAASHWVSRRVPGAPAMVRSRLRPPAERR